MKEVELVIKIPEEEYNIIKKSNAPMSWAEHLIKNGTPLPKGHGDLIDRRELLKLPIDKANYPSNYVKYAPTIIERDGDSK